MTSANPPARPAVDPGVGVLDDDRPLRTHTESARGFEQDGRIRLARQAQFVGNDTVDADREQVINPGGFQDLFTVAADE